MAYRVSKIAAQPDGANPALILPSEMNPMTNPGIGTQNDIWIEITGTSPTRKIALKVFDLGAWRELAAVQY
jgi:hypothetical protein